MRSLVIACSLVVSFHGFAPLRPQPRTGPSGSRAKAGWARPRMNIGAPHPHTVTRERRRRSCPSMIELAGITSQDVVYEPGCGDARLVIAAIKAGARKGLGVDIDPDLAERAYADVKAAGVSDKIEIRWGNALDVDMSDTTVVFLFMGEAFNLVMRPLLWQQLKVGARVVSNDFSMGDWKPDRTLRVDTPTRSYVLYLWTITPEIKNRAAAIR